MDKEINLMSLVIGHRIRQKRKERDMSQSELGQAIGSQSMISQYESAKLTPRSDVLELIAHKLEDDSLMSYAELLRTNKCLEPSIHINNYRDFIQVLDEHRGQWLRSHNEVARQILRLLYESDCQGEMSRFVKSVLMRSDDPTILAEAKFYLGGTLLRQGKYTEARSWLQEAFECKMYLSVEIRARLHYNMGYLFTYLDNQGLALWHASRAISGFNEVFIPHLQAKAMALQGTVHVELGQFDQARFILTRALDVLNSVNDFDTGRILNTMADAELLTGNYEEAELYAKQALMRVKLEDYLCQSDIYRVLTEVEFRRGNLYAADGYLRCSFEFASKAKDHTNEAHLCLLAIEIVTDVHMKLSYAKRAFDLTKDTGDYHILAFASEYMAGLLKRLDGPSEEITFFKDSALMAYRTHVEMHSKFSITAHRLKVFNSSCC